jgi:hypothetical protein
MRARFHEHTPQLGLRFLLQTRSLVVLSIMERLIYGTSYLRS